MSSQPLRVVSYPNDQKRCARCLLMLPVEQFSTFVLRRGRHTLYRSSRCKKCHSESQRDPAMAGRRVARDATRAEVRKLRGEGLGFQEIANRLAITVNRAWRNSHDVAVPEQKAKPMELRVVTYEGGVKRCGSCGLIKPEDAFRQIRSRSSRRHHVYYLRRNSYCNPCHAEFNRKAYSKNGEHKKRAFRVGPNPAHVGLPSQAPGRVKGPPAIVLCVCGVLEKGHARDGKGSCAATGCPEFMERGL